MFKKLLLLSLLAITTSATADGLGTYSIGYRFGELTKFGVKGIFVKSGEGQLLLGVNSSTVRASRDRPFANPWRFSSSIKSITNELNDNIGDYIVLKYKQSHIKSPMVDTDYDITEVIKVTDELTESCSTGNYNKGIKSNTTRSGRIVKASSKGLAFNSYEIVLQQGNGGNQFKALSITVKDIYNCAVRFLKAGQKVKIKYSESLLNMDLTGRETAYDIISIEPLKSFK